MRTVMLSFPFHTGKLLRTISSIVHIQQLLVLVVNNAVMAVSLQVAMLKANTSAELLKRQALSKLIRI